MEIKIITDNTKGQVLTYDGEEQVGQLNFTFKGEVMSIDHTEAFKKGVGIGALLVEAANEYAINHKLKVLPICSYAWVWYQRHPQYKDILDEHAGEGVSCQL